MGAMMGGTVGLIIGFIFGATNIIRYGPGPNGMLRTLGQYMLGSAATFRYDNLHMRACEAPANLSYDGKCLHGRWHNDSYRELSHPYRSLQASTSTAWQACDYTSAATQKRKGATDVSVVRKRKA